MLFKEFPIRAFWGQNVGPGWVKNDKKGYNIQVTPNLVLPKNKVPNSHSLLFFNPYILQLK